MDDAEIRTEVLAGIRDGSATTANAIIGRLVHLHGFDVAQWRRVDRAIQRLRKAGEIAYANKKWTAKDNPDV